MTVSSDTQNEQQPETESSHRLELIRQPSSLFLYSGLFFLFAALFLFLLLGYILYRISEGNMPIIGMLETSADLTAREIYNFYGRVFSALMAPLFLVFSALVCTVIGIRLLRTVGAVSQQVIPPQDFAILAPAVRDGNEKAISEYIRLSSLSGITGTFTKVGLTGLPLATIILTITLSILGVFNAKFFDLAQLTLGAFIGSYVQKRSEVETSRTTGTKDNPFPR